MNKAILGPRTGGRLFLVLMMLLSATVLALAADGLFGALRYTFLGKAADGKVLEFHHTSGRSASVIAHVQVSVPGVLPFSQDVFDSLGSQEWAVGGAVRLRCIHGAEWNCRVDSVADAFLWPFVFCLAGGGGVFWSGRSWVARRRDATPLEERARPKAPNRKPARRESAATSSDSSKVPLFLRVALRFVAAYLLSWQTLAATFVLGAGGLFLMLGWHFSGLEHRGEYKALTAHADARVTESWLALDFDAARIRNPANWATSVQAEPCILIEYGEFWGAPLREALCGNRFPFQGYTTRWPDLGDLTRGVPFVWQHDRRGFAVPEIRLDPGAYEWLAAHPPDFFANSEFHSRTALDSVLAEQDLPVEAAVLGWTTPSQILSVSYDPQHPAGALPTAVVEERRGESVHPVALLAMLLGAGVFMAGMAILPLTADLGPWVRSALSVALLCTLPWWPLYFLGALGRLNPQTTRLFAGMYADIDPTGRLVVTAPEEAAQARGRRLVWRLEDGAYADTLGRLAFVPPQRPFPSGDAALRGLTEAAGAEVRALDAKSRADLFAGLLRLHRGGRRDVTKLFLPPAKELVAGAWPDSGGKEAAERFLKDVE